MRFYNDSIINKANAAINQNSIFVDSKFCRFASAQAVVTGTAAGTLKLQVSNDNAATPTNWSDLTGATVSISGVGTYLIPTQNTSYQFIRAVYTAASGVGAITVNLNMVGY